LLATVRVVNRMRVFSKSILLIAGIGFVLWSLKPFGLLLFGCEADGVIIEVVTSSLKTEMKGGRRSIHKPTGFFSVDTTVRYAFDVLPTPVEALQQLSDAPIAANVTGSDTLYGKTRFPDIPMYTTGHPLRVIFLKPLPSFNAAYQPNSMLTYGIVRLIGGLVLFVWGVLISSVGNKKDENGES
jgi:hypothetical protein